MLGAKWRTRGNQVVPPPARWGLLPSTIYRPQHNMNGNSLDTVEKQLGILRHAEFGHKQPVIRFEAEDILQVIFIN